MKSVAIIIVTYNDSRFIIPCLERLRGAVGQDEVSLVVVDNNSIDDTRSLIKKHFPEVVVKKMAENLKLSRALNVGAEMFPANNYVFLNPDVLIGYEQIKELLRFMGTDRQIGIVGPRLVYPTGEIQYSCRRFPTLWNILLRGLGLTENKPFMPKSLHHYLMTEYSHNTTRSVDWLLLACMVVRQEAIREVGGFNENFPLYYNDIEMCWRMWKNGWRVIYYPDVSIVHYYQRSSAKGLLFNRAKWRHLISALRFLIKKNFL